MSDKFRSDFKRSIETGFLDNEIDSESLYRPKLLVNRKIPKEKVLSTLLQELNYCEEFYISVAFVTTSGIATLFNTLLDLEDKGVKGLVLVSQYLNFTQPEALKKLLQFKNIDLRIATKTSSHSKGYIFKRNDFYNIIIGSSNLTASALTTNKEWNLKVSGLHSSQIVDNTLKEFETDFEEAITVDEKFIEGYIKDYNKTKVSNNSNLKVDKQEIIPNQMQKEALKNLNKFRLENKNKALIISATGTGKTYLSAFDVKSFKPKKLLFVVHRLNIAEKALKTFRKIFDNTTLGIYSGDKKELNADFIFSTIQTISRKEHLQIFDKNHFDYIILDESHRSGANSYLKLLEYFEPKFLLGMTATPERTDGNDIFSLFDHNIAYEIRLNRAMEEGMLSEFHYYGITDLIINNEAKEDTKDFSLLDYDEKAARIIEKANLYGTANGITRGLVFCSRNEESKLLAQKFTEKGFKSISLSGDNSEQERIEAINRLESNDIAKKIDYIFTVDIFNEGIDIPKINQILMIRPTESAIVFVQQLGRGLRKVEGKDYLTVIDFIGNHKNNYLIPVALYGDTSFNKDSLRKLISEGSRLIPGSSTINFDQISKEKIFKSIDTANMKVLTDLKKDYNLLKYRLGRTPMMMDFLSYESRDPFLFVEYSKSYYNFVIKVDKDFTFNLDKEKITLLELFSREINNAKRAEESYLLQRLLEKNHLTLNDFKSSFYLKYGYKLKQKTILSVLRNLNFSFIKKDRTIVEMIGKEICFSNDFLQHLDNQTFKLFLIDSVKYSLSEFEKKYKKELFRNGLILYAKYSRKDVCRLLNWEKDISSTVYGYRTRDNITPCFVTYHKSHEIEESINYNDYFVSESVFAWESRSKRKIESSEIQNVINSERILLFVKKEDAEGTEFYYMGDCSIIPGSIEQAIMPKSNDSVVHFKFKLEQPVSEDLYRYITSSNNIQEELKNDAEEQIEEVKEKPTIPFYDFYAAAGSFSELQSEKSFSEIEVDEKYSLNEDYFACKIFGESMNKRIPNGSICIFKKYKGGSRSGKILLIENYDKQDPDFNSAFTVKTYMSQKRVSEEGWEHLEIVLKPNSYDSSYEDIIINQQNAHEMHIVGEFVDVIT